MATSIKLYIDSHFLESQAADDQDDNSTHTSDDRTQYYDNIKCNGGRERK